MDAATLWMWTDLLDLDGFEVVEAESDRASIPADRLKVSDSAPWTWLHDSIGEE
jgi:hypothetical protein